MYYSIYMCKVLNTEINIFGCVSCMYGAVRVH